MKYPNWVGKVVLIQVATSGPSSRNLQNDISDIVNRVNGTFGSLEYTPIVFLNQNIPFSQYLALLAIADVCLITSLRDGMNLTSHEYVCCQKENYSPLILSEFTGTYGSLSGAIRINPWNYIEVADCINEALSMSLEEKKLRHMELLKYVTTNTGQFWTESFIKQIIKMDAFSNEKSSMKKDLSTVVSNYLNANNRILIFNFDGSQQGVEKHVNIKPSDEYLSLLKQLSEDPKNHILILSSRTKSVIDQWFSSINGIYLSAEHGCFFKKNEEDWVSQIRNTNSKDAWMNEVTEILNYYTERTQGSEIETRERSIAWYYQGADEAYGVWQAKECQHLLEEMICEKYSVRITTSQSSIELFPKNVGKLQVTRQFLSKKDFDFSLCVGADQEENLLEFLKNQPATTTISIGQKTCSASFTFPTENDLFSLIKKFLNVNDI